MTCQRNNNLTKCLIGLINHCASLWTRPIYHTKCGEFRTSPAIFLLNKRPWDLDARHQQLYDSMRMDACWFLVEFAWSGIVFGSDPSDSELYTGRAYVIWAMRYLTGANNNASNKVSPSRLSQTSMSHWLVAACNAPMRWPMWIWQRTQLL